MFVLLQTWKNPGRLETSQLARDAQRQTGGAGFKQRGRQAPIPEISLHHDTCTHNTPTHTYPHIPSTPPSTHSLKQSLIQFPLHYYVIKKNANVFCLEVKAVMEEVGGQDRVTEVSRLQSVSDRGYCAQACSQC